MYNDVDDMLRASQQKRDQASKAAKKSKLPSLKRSDKSSPSPEEVDSKKMSKKQKRIIKLILIFFVFPIILVGLFLVGMAAGYQYGGGEAGEVFDGNTWRNIIFIIFG